MSENETNRPTQVRFQVRQPGGPFMRVVWDTWLEVEAARFYGAYAGAPLGGEGTAEAISERAQLLAETRASELNLKYADPLGFIEKLAQHIAYARNEAEESAGNVLEDVDKILEHYMGQLRGVKVEPLDMPNLYVQAPWVNRHGLGA